MNKKNFLLLYLSVPLSITWALDSNSESHTHSEIYQLDDFIVQSSPLALTQSEKTQSSSILQDRDLNSKRSESIAKILADQPGVSQSNYGPNANRPIIRGLDGFRISILENGLSAFDLSATSADHAVSIDPLLVDRIEVLRGASSLIYGANSIGGLVNVFDNSIPNTLNGRTFDNRFRTHYSSVNDGFSRGAILYHSVDNFVFQINGIISESNDYEAPSFEADHHEHDHEHVQYAKILTGETAPLLGTLHLEDHGDGNDDDHDGDHDLVQIVENTHSETRSFGFGGSYTHANGFIGLSFSEYESAYGVPNHENSVLDINRQKFTIQSFYNFDSGLFDNLDFKLAYGDYSHSEEGSGHADDEVDLFHLEGTIVEPIVHDDEDEHEHHHAKFITEGFDSSLLFTKRTGFSNFALSINYSDKDMKIEGEESYLAAMKHHADQNDENTGTLDESTNLRIQNDSTRRYGFAILQSKNVSPFLSVNGGIRYDAVSCDYEALTRVDDHDTLPNNADFKREDSSLNGSLGFVLKESDLVTLSANLHYAERIPETSELYSSGAHHATESFEMGNPDLENEQSVGVEFAISRNEGDLNQKLSFYCNDYDNFIYQSDTGFKTGTDLWRRPTADEVTADASAPIPLDPSRDLVRAEFEELSIREYKGVEAKIYGLEYQYNYKLSDNSFIKGFVDYIEAKNETDGIALPRIMPWRAGMSYHYCDHSTSFDISATYHGKQDDLAEGESITESYTLLDCRFGYFLDKLDKSSEVYLKVNNLTDELAFTHTSFLKDSAPLPGRNIQVGLNYRF